MSVTAKFLNDSQFVHTHDILSDGEFPSFKVRNPIEQGASVYMWLSPLNESEFEVLYIGKAGYGVNNRFGQHASGFKNSNTGKANCELIQKHISAGGIISVFARNSECQKLFGFPTSIALYSAEEEALCDQFNPLWNRAKFPSKAKKISNKVSDGEGRQALYEVDDLNVPIDFSEMARGGDVSSFYMSLNYQDRNLFLQILALIEDTPELAVLQQKIVDGYSEQPQGYNKVPMINFAMIHESGRAVANSWGIRVPLINAESSPLTVILPKKYINQKCDPDAIEWGSSDSFRPKSLSDFLINKAKYIMI